MGFLRAVVFLAVLSVSLGLHSGGHPRCPCIENHTEEVKHRLAHDGQAHDRFGIGCRTHPVSASLAERIFEVEVAAQLACDPVSECPWGPSKWCYVDPRTCSMEWDWGVLGPFSHATCGNLRGGTAEYLVNSLAVFLRHDPLRVVHVESTLRHGYLGNTNCQESNVYHGPHQRCDGVVDKFWNRSLVSLNNSHVNIEHDIWKGTGLKNSEIADMFEMYKQNYPEKWAHRASTNFDLCAFAAAMGHVDLCVGTFGLTHERQEMAFPIELYTSPVYMISESTCGFMATSEWRSFGYWFWWLQVFHWKAWCFFVAVVFILSVTMWRLDQKPAPIHDVFADLILGPFEAFVNKSKPTYSRNKKANTALPSHMVGMGLAFFLLMTTTIYGSSIVAKLISAREKLGKFPTIQSAMLQSKPPVHLCVHEVFHEAVELRFRDNNESKIVKKWMTEWEEVRTGLENGTCNASLVEEDVWKTWRGEGYLCHFHREPEPEFYMPVGAFVSSRAHRTLETFRFDPAESGAFLEEPRHLRDFCAQGSADGLCRDEGGVPWFTFSALGAVAAVCCLCGLFLHCRGFGGEDEPESKQGGPRDLEAPDLVAEEDMATEDAGTQAADKTSIERESTGSGGETQLQVELNSSNT